MNQDGNSNGAGHTAVIMTNARVWRRGPGSSDDVGCGGFFGGREILV